MTAQLGGNVAPVTRGARGSHRVRPAVSAKGVSLNNVAGPHRRKAHKASWSCDRLGLALGMAQCITAQLPGADGGNWMN
ncbi:MAG: hypothetical protein AAF727_13655 [Pseudomonadota bacterium]